MRKEPDAVRNDILFLRDNHYGLPGKLACDSGGELSANPFADPHADTDIRLARQPRSSHAFLAESRIRAGRTFQTRMRLVSPDASNEYLLHRITRRLNEMLSEDCIPPGTAVFGWAQGVSHMCLSMIQLMFEALRTSSPARCPFRRRESDRWPYK